MALSVSLSFSSITLSFSSEEGITPNTHVDIAGTITKGADINWSDVALTFTFTVENDKNGNFTKYVKTTNPASVSEYLTLTYTDQKAGSPDAAACPVGGEGTKLTIDQADGTFDLDLDLNWGLFFGDGENPSKYYDGAGASTSFSEVKSVLNNLYSLNGLTFKVTLEATLNTVGE